MFRIFLLAFTWILLLSSALTLSHASGASIEDLVTAAKRKRTVGF
jgi:hypothetical protein